MAKLNYPKELATGYDKTNLQDVLNNMVTNIDSALGSGSLFPQNILINGGVEIWQRGTDFNPIGADAYSSDRWKSYNTGGSVWRIEKDTTTVKSSGTSMKITISTAGSESWVYQLVENWSAYKGKTVAFSVWVYSTVANKIQALVSDGATATASSVHKGTGWERLTIVHTVSNSAFQLNTNMMGYWTANATTGTFYVADAMLVVGSEPMDYVIPDPQSELARCQRYYCKSYDIGVFAGANPNYNGCNQTATTGHTNRPYTYDRFPVSMRLSAPSVVFYSPQTGTQGKCYDINGATDLNVGYSQRGNSGFGWNAYGTPAAGNAIAVHWIADAEI
jgi:hypothetical protein